MVQNVRARSVLRLAVQAGKPLPQRALQFVIAKHLGRPSRKALYQRTLQLVVAKRIKFARPANPSALDAVASENADFFDCRNASAELAASVHLSVGRETHQLSPCRE
jgi:hypothetical protein